jgi:hypothetical protein
VSSEDSIKRIEHLLSQVAEHSTAEPLALTALQTCLQLLRAQGDNNTAIAEGMKAVMVPIAEALATLVEQVAGLVQHVGELTERVIALES